MIINDIRGAIGRNVNFVLETRTDCPACGIDPYTNTSTNPFCTTCSGNGYLVTYSGVLVSGHITWNPSETMNWLAGGKYNEYSCRVQIEYTPANVALADDAAYLEVDTKRLKIVNKTFRGVKDINRILLDLKEP